MRRRRRGDKNSAEDEGSGWSGFGTRHDSATIDTIASRGGSCEGGRGGSDGGDASPVSMSFLFFRYPIKRQGRGTYKVAGVTVASRKLEQSALPWAGRVAMRVARTARRQLSALHPGGSEFGMQAASAMKHWNAVIKCIFGTRGWNCADSDRTKEGEGERRSPVLLPLVFVLHESFSIREQRT